MVGLERVPAPGEKLRPSLHPQCCRCAAEARLVMSAVEGCGFAAGGMPRVTSGRCRRVVAPCIAGGRQGSLVRGDGRVGSRPLLVIVWEVWRGEAPTFGSAPCHMRDVVRLAVRGSSSHSTSVSGDGSVPSPLRRRSSLVPTPPSPSARRKTARPLGQGAQCATAGHVGRVPVHWAATVRGWMTGMVGGPMGHQRSLDA